MPQSRRGGPCPGEAVRRPPRPATQAAFARASTTAEPGQEGSKWQVAVWQGLLVARGVARRVHPAILSSPGPAAPTGERAPRLDCLPGERSARATRHTTTGDAAERRPLRASPIRMTPDPVEIRELPVGETHRAHKANASAAPRLRERAGLRRACRRR